MEEILRELACGKITVEEAAKTLKINGTQVPISAYDCFSALSDLGVVNDSELTTWNATIGLRNRIVHDYMNIDMSRVIELVKNEQYRFITDFLLAPISEFKT